MVRGRENSEVGSAGADRIVGVPLVSIGPVGDRGEGAEGGIPIGIGRWFASSML